MYEQRRADRTEVVEACSGIGICYYSTGGWYSFSNCFCWRKGT